MQILSQSHQCGKNGVIDHLETDKLDDRELWLSSSLPNNSLLNEQAQFCNLNQYLRKNVIQKNLFLNNNLLMNSLIKSFGFAFQGIWHLLRRERNFKIQFIVFILVLILSFLLKISKIEWLAILICSMIVLSLEGLNTSIERLCNKQEPNFNPSIKIIKDVAAGSVLIASIVSVIIGFLVFFPHFYKLVASL
jgi:diacylglycerol kinase